MQNNYIISNGTEVKPQTKYSVKGDHNLGSKDRFSGYIGWNRTAAQPGPGGPRTLPGYYSDYNDLTRNSDVYRISWDHNFSPTFLNHFYAGGNNWKENHDPIQATVKAGIDWKDKICLPNAPDCDQNLVNLRFTDYGGWGGPANNGSENDIYAFNNDSHGSRAATPSNSVACSSRATTTASAARTSPAAPTSATIGTGAPA